MTIDSTSKASHSILSPQQSLELANVCLESAHTAKDIELVAELCHDADTVLSEAKNSLRGVHASKKTDNQSLHGIAAAYCELGDLWDSLGEIDKAHASYSKAEKLGYSPPAEHPVQQTTPVPRCNCPSEHGCQHMTDESLDIKPTSPSPRQQKPRSDIAQIPQHIFPENIDPPVTTFKLPEDEERLSDTQQLAYCLALLHTSEAILDPSARKWVQAVLDDVDEQERLMNLARDVVREYVNDELKGIPAISEVVYLAPVLEKGLFRDLLLRFYSGIEHSDLLNIHQLEGIGQMIHSASPGYLNAADLVTILDLFGSRLRDTHQQSQNYIYQLTTIVSRVLDAMVDIHVKGLDREKVHEPLTSYLNGLKGNSDPFMVFQAAYAFQALLCVPDNETIWQATKRRTGKVIQGVSGIVSAAKGLDVKKFVEGLGYIQQGVEGTSALIGLSKSAYQDVKSLAESGQGFMDSLKEGLSFDRKCAWYPALRKSDILIQDCQFAKFRRLVCEAPCRRDPAFQWGVCQRLGEIAANTKWDTNTRKSAVAFLGEIYRNDLMWGQQVTVKQWILNILMQLALSETISQCAEDLLTDVGASGDITKQALYRKCREAGPSPYPLRFDVLSLTSSALLDRVQNKPDVDNSLRQLRKRRLKERGSTVYIPPQANSSAHAPDHARFPLMQKVKEFLNSGRRVLLLQGDSGAGKSTFNLELECELWRTYSKDYRIPLYINLPAIDKPEHDMIAKHLKKADFSEPQIRELKLSRKFILVCDGYDESQQTRNLYESNLLNQSGEWNALMVISCRSEYLGADYRDRFQPVDRNQQPDPSLFQEAVITPFSEDQVQDYIKQYVSLRQPLWKTEDYQKTLDLIPSLKDLVRNPFLLTLSLEVLPRMVDPGQQISESFVTRVALYDQFVEQWLERGKKRLEERKLSDQARAAFDSLSDEGFTRNGIDYLKRLCVAIYKEQNGHPVIEYSRFKDEGSWKASFFSREDEKSLLREASPLTRSGSQYRFIHRSLLEYGLTRAIFDPQDHKKVPKTEPVSSRRGSMCSVMSFEIEGGFIEPTAATTDQQSMDPSSPLVWRSFVNETLVIHFLSERVQQEPALKSQLLAYIEHSKLDKKWRVAAANAITILVKSGMRFSGANLRGIQIPGADLSYGVFDSSQLQGADLRKANLRNIWLRRSDLSRSQMRGARFGELPPLVTGSGALICVNLPDTKTLVVGHNDGNVSLYSTLNWEKIRTLSGHEGRIEKVAPSPEGDQIATICGDAIVRLWDVETGVCRHRLSGHGGRVSTIIYSPKYNQIASGGVDGTVRLWNTETGVCGRVLEGHGGLVSCVAYSPEGDMIVSCGHDYTVCLWNVATGVRRHKMEGHTNLVESVVFSPKGDQVVSSGNDMTVRVWDVKTGICCNVLKEHDDTISIIVYSPQGETLASASQNGTIILWDTQPWTYRRILRGHSMGITSVIYLSKSDQIASASTDHTAKLWDLKTGECVSTLTSHSAEVTSIAYSSSDNLIATSSLDQTIRIWDVEVSAVGRTSVSHSAGVRSVHGSPNGDRIASASVDYTVRLWDVESGVCRHVLKSHRRAVTCVVYSPKGDQVASCSDDGTVQLWNAETGASHHTLSDHEGRIASIAYSPRGNMIASGGSDCAVRIWNTETGDCCRTMDGHTNWVTKVAFSPKGSRIVSSSKDTTLRLWDPDTGSCLHVSSGHTEWVTCVAYSPGGEQIASGSDDQTVRLWNAETGTCLQVLQGHSKEVQTVVFSPDGNQVASASWDNTVRLWDVKAGTCFQTLKGHTDWVNSVAYSATGEFVASASNDKTVLVWDTTAGQILDAIRGFSGAIHSIAWSASSDASYLITGGEDGSVRMWKVITVEDARRIGLHWSSIVDSLVSADSFIEDVQGLSRLSLELLERGGALGGPGLFLPKAPGPEEPIFFEGVLSERRVVEEFIEDEVIE